MPDVRPAFRVYPITRVDVYAQVYEQLDRLVATLQPGDKLPPERELGERLGVSRVVLREALRALESAGKIEIRRQSGSFVRHPNGTALANQLRSVASVDETFLNHLVDVRAAVEVKVVALVGRTGRRDLPEVAALLDRLAADLPEASEASGPGSLDLRFEALLGRLTGNPVLAEMQRNVHHLWVEAWSACGLAPGSRTDLHAEHVAVYEALAAGDVATAERLMAEHVDRIVAR